MSCLLNELFNFTFFPYTPLFGPAIRDSDHATGWTAQGLNPSGTIFCGPEAQPAPFPGGKAAGVCP